MVSTAQVYSLHEDLEQLLNHRGLLKKVADECGADYRRVHELVTEKSEPRHTLGKDLEDWIHCASLLAATKADLTASRQIPFTRLMRLLELKDRVSAPFLKMKIDGVVELLGPVAKRVRPTAQEFVQELEREQSHHKQAKNLIDSSISTLLTDIESLLK